MNRLPLTIACRNYDRVQPLIDGTVQPEGIDLRVISLPVEETFWRQVHHREFDGSELSMSSYLVGRSRGSLPFIAIPVFPSRYFRHSCVFVNPASGIQRPEDLRGKRVAVPEYQVTAALWIRGFLADDYGVTADQISWFTGGMDDAGREEKIQLELPPNISIESIPKGRTINEMLDNGEFDAYIGPRIPRAFWRDDNRLVRLFPDYETVEADYFKRTGIFPIMHVIALREETYQANPWVAMSLFKAFAQAKAVALRQMEDASALQYMLPWMLAALEKARSLMGKDFWPYGVESSRTTLEKITQYSYDQGLSRRKLDVDELFAPNTLDEFKI